MSHQFNYQADPMEEFQMNILAFLSDEGQHFSEEFIEHIGEESEVETAIEHLVVQGYIINGERGSWLITEEGLEAYNEQVEKDE
jgi:predicted transcriptional regulator